MATVALNGARNAGILAAQILSAGDPDLRDHLIRFKEELREMVMEKAARMKS